jgi:hypothetical protein
MARWMIGGDWGWPVGQFVIPAGTVIDSADWKWGGFPLPLAVPIDAICLDQEAYNISLSWYGGDQRKRLLYVAGRGSGPLTEE